MVAAAVTNGDILVQDAIAEHNLPLISKLKEMGVTVVEQDNGIRVIGTSVLLPANVTTMPHPGYPTDLQPQISVLQLLANGVSTLNETVFENRFMHLDELRRMNASVTIQGSTAVLNGPAKLNGAEVEATDLRAAAALVLAGLAAEGYTQVTNLKYLDRGYYRFHEKLHALGADIKRVEDVDNVTINVNSALKPEK
jgi:UDP-N-acetylglucosamine 1-carboxyvinyltransferase